MLELYLDSANTAEISKLADSLSLTGITTNPTILANAGIGVSELLPTVSAILGANCRFHVQLLSQNLEGMLAEARQLHALPFDIIVKVPCHSTGLTAIKHLKKLDIPVLATAIYNVQQGLLAALNGADYLAAYLNRIDNLGFDGIGVVSDLQNLIDQHQIPCKQLVASFKNVQQVLQVCKLGVSAVTLPIEIAQQMLHNPATDAAVEKFNSDWQAVFADRLAFNS